MPTMTTTDITMPQLGESVTEGTIGTWLKSVGDRIDKYDPIVEVESDKASSELPSPISGVIVEILVEPGTTVPVGTAICRVDVSGDQESIESPSTARVNEVTAQTDDLTQLRVRSSPFVRRTAEEFGIDIGEIDGSGVGGRVTKRDVLAFVSSLQSGPASGTPGEPPSLTTPSRPSAPSRDDVVPVSSMRRSIAETMVRSVTTAPQATVVMEVDMTRIVTWRTATKDEFQAREGVALTYLPIVLAAVATTLREHPRLNAVWDDDHIIHRREIHLGVAVALDDGLVVPVIRNADRLNLSGLAHALDDLTTRARTGVLTPDDMRDGTFTVNNPGTFGSLVSTPILVPPQVGILSTEAIIKRPVVIDDMIAIRSMMNLSLTIDHRALDGLGATRFLQAVRKRLESYDVERTPA